MTFFGQAKSRPKQGAGLPAPAPDNNPSLTLVQGESEPQASPSSGLWMMLVIWPGVVLGIVLTFVWMGFIGWAILRALEMLSTSLLGR